MTLSWPAMAPPMGAHRPVVMGRRGIVVAGHHTAAEAGAAMLRAGGNAIDAAVAAAATLAIATPFMNGLGGDSIALYARPATDIVAINGSGAVARAASVAELRRRGYSAMPQRGAVTVSVPGFVAALGETLERFGTMRPAQVLEPAIALAEEGVPLDASALGFFNGPLYHELAAEYPALAALFGAPGGRRLGENLKQPAAAQVLRRLATKGWRAFYTGRLAQEWLTVAREAGVLLDGDDLANHRTEFTTALAVTWRGRRVHAAPPNSQGLALLALLAFDEAQPTPPPRDGFDPIFDPAAFLRHKSKAFALRDAYCADPRRVSLPPNILDASSLLAVDLPSSPRQSGGGDTSTLVVIDADGRAVSWVQSLFDEFGSGIVCPEHGIVLHNRAALERLDDDPVRGLKGGFRPFHTLCPVLVTGPGGEIMALATPGDHGQPQTLAQLLRRHLVQGLDLQAAIEWPRLRHDAGDEVMLEGRCPAAWDAMLAEAGWRVRRVGTWSRLMGGAGAILRRPDGLLMAGADPRRSGYAIAV